MPSYCAFLGHQPHLSLAELSVLLPDFKVQKMWQPQIVTFDTKLEIDETWLNGIGGTVLIAKELSVPSAKKKDANLEKIIPSLLHGELKGVKKKAVFSFRCFGVARSQIRTLYRVCKLHLKSRELSSRYIGNERHPAKPGTLLLRGIPGPGNCEVVILRDEKKGARVKDDEPIWIGSTIAVQDIEAYTERDMGKPFRDTQTGLLPPKLAQVMLNLAFLTLPLDPPTPGKTKKKDGSVWEKITVWDPFCGSGVIALEAVLRRAHILASDKTEKAVKGCIENIKWMRNREKTPKAVTHHIWKQNALKPCELARNPSVIVTETSLGPPLKKAPTKKDVASLIRDAEKLELGFFENIAKVVPETPVICSFPVYITKDGTKHFLPKVLGKIEKLGYRLTCVSNPHIKATDRHSLLYLRPDQYVGREILSFLPPQKKS